MTILGFETSGKTASVALMNDDTLLALNTVVTSRSHSRVIMPMCTQILFAAEKSLDDVDLLAVCIGPGSYTGLRIGIAAVKAISFAKGIPCAGISTLEGLAAQLCSFRGLVVAVMSARADLLYSASFRADGQRIARITEDRMISRDALMQELRASEEEFLLTGDAAAELGEKGGYQVAPISLRLQSAAGICLAASHKSPVSADELDASYLQITKAEKDLREKCHES